MDYQQGYCTALPYVHHYHRELSPSFLNFICTLNNFQAPADETKAFRYCDLGVVMQTHYYFQQRVFQRLNFMALTLCKRISNLPKA
ncbi:hypothetical protein [Piscirickettsia litoralis]|uniref:Uncharacterized protein n=1 Tax=Piscirickettsia litoralis TaxID=1891921 RepID=A0ABX3A4C3_9GAMM|nr:hypothetical protein [Piscirickettsia litoralis]ODN43714.1 hypothetical protein BGC07_13420 [Piscirickettsia litoralis]